MSQHDDFLRAHRQRPGPSEPEPRQEETKKPQKAQPPLITQGARSSPPLRAPKTPDDVLRGIAGDWRRPTWTSIF
jgi:hypothetical protein